MIKNVNGKNVKIPDEVIANFMKSLKITEEDAVQMWLEDEGYFENEEVEEMTKKAKANKTDKIVATDKTKARAKTERKPKENPLKTKIIKYLFDYLVKNGSLLAVDITNPTKSIDFIAENKHFTLNLVEHREKKPKN